MPKVDDELTRRLHEAERPVQVDGLFEGLERRRAHRQTLRKAQAGLLAFAVIAATLGGFVALRQAFGGGGRTGGDDPSPALPANGEIVFSARGRDGYTHLYAVEPDGSGRRQITDFGTNDTDPVVSPDGRTIAFVHQLEDVSPAIATIPIEGGTVTWQTPQDLSAADPAWSPDGTRIAFVGRSSDRAGLYVVRVNSVEPEPLTSRLDVEAAEPTWSPDGTRIAFALRGRTGPWGLASIRPDGTGLEPLATPVSDEDAPAWSPDGSRIAFMRTYREQDGIWTMPAGGGEAQLVAYAAELEHDLAWAPDGSALLVSDGEWIYRMDATSSGEPDTNLVQLVRGSSPAWQPLPVGSAPPSPMPEPSPSPSPGSGDADIGLGFRLCHLSRLDGVDFLGDGAAGIAWVGTRTRDNGSCPQQVGSRAVVAADFNGDGIADSWSGDTIAYCSGCEPFKAVDMNADGREELIVVLQYFSIMQYGVYTVVPVEGEMQVVPFRTGEPGHPQHALEAGKPFTLWVGGDAGAAEYFYCDTLPEIWLTATETPIDAGPDDVTTVHETHVSFGTDAIAHILDANTFTVPADVLIDLEHATSKPDCGLGVDLWGGPA